MPKPELHRACRALLAGGSAGLSDEPVPESDADGMTRTQSGSTHSCICPGAMHVTGLARCHPSRQSRQHAAASSCASQSNPSAHLVADGGVGQRADVEVCSVCPLLCLLSGLSISCGSTDPRNLLLLDELT